jgi:hypothetical protein
MNHLKLAFFNLPQDMQQAVAMREYLKADFLVEQYIAKGVPVPEAVTEDLAYWKEATADLKMVPAYVQH